MSLFILGLVLFLGSHSVRVFADGWRSKMIENMGEKMFKGMYSVASLVGFVLLVYGFSQIRWTVRCCGTLLWQRGISLLF